MFTAIAYAAAGQPGGSGGDAGGMLGLMAPMLLMFAVFYFLLIRPQQKKTKQHRSMLNALQKGDHVLTNGGLLGRIVEVEGDILTVDLGETKVRVPRGFINGTYDPKALNSVSSQAPEAK
jgi:preprotein translocase subunit YajC